MKNWMTVGMCSVVLIAGAGCGNDLGTSADENVKLADLSGKDAEFAAELVTAMTESEDSPIVTDQAECWSNRLVSDFGVDRLKEVGVTAEKFATNEGPDALSKLSESEQETFTDGFVKCIDMVEMMLSSAAQDGEVTPAMEKCFKNAVTDDTEAAMAQVMIQGDEAAEDDPELAAAIAPLMGCMFMGLDSGDMEVDTSGADTSTTMSD